MKKTLSVLAAIAGIAGASAILAPETAAQAIGQAAPNFTLTDANGRSVSLANFRGRTVVLEWNNPECPFVRKHYGSGNMQRTQAAATRAGAVWLTINSSAAGNQGHLNGAGAQAHLASSGSRPTAYLLDPRGTVGRSYGARTTPHMYIVNTAGNIVYAGGIDDRPTANPADINGARNHVLAALTEIRAGRPVSVASTRPYGCAVKY